MKDARFSWPSLEPMTAVFVLNHITSKIANYHAMNCHKEATKLLLTKCTFRYPFILPKNINRVALKFSTVFPSGHKKMKENNGNCDMRRGNIMGRINNKFHFNLTTKQIHFHIKMILMTVLMNEGWVCEA